MLSLVYVFSMTLEEGYRLAGYDRYNMTMIIYLYSAIIYLLLAYLGNNEQIFSGEINANIKRIFISVSLSIILFIAPAFYVIQKDYLLYRTLPHLPENSPFYELMGNYANEIPDSYAYKYAIYISSSNIQQESYYFLLCSFKLNSYNTKIIYSPKNSEEFLSSISDCDYLLVAESDKFLDDTLREFSGEEHKDGQYFYVQSILDYYNYTK